MLQKTRVRVRIFEELLRFGAFGGIIKENMFGGTYGK